MTFRALPGRQEIVLLLLLIGVLLLAGRLSPDFLSARAQNELSTHVWELALLALPMTLIILTAGIDLSVGSTMALCAVAFGLYFRAGWPIPVDAGLALLVGAAAGALNGVFVAYVRVHPLIVTLATLAAYRGVAEGVSLGRPFSGFPPGFAVLGQGSLAGLPIPGLIFLAALLVTALLLAFTPLGLWLSAIGYNETAARYSGLAVSRLKFGLYTASGLAAGLAALLFVARRNTAKADIGTGMELDVITAVVLGGTSIFGGRGGLLGTVLGVLLIHETREFVSWQWSRDELNLIVVGALLILSVLADSLLSPRRRQ
ncbi:MAG: ABC transporter permease [Armatimonadetes bacterium]|nr:ABC transporter permease [Armatimonadota bacterium]